jgi:hypothetical protein
VAGGETEWGTAGLSAARLGHKPAGPAEAGAVVGGRYRI